MKPSRALFLCVMASFALAACASQAGPQPGTGSVAPTEPPSSNNPLANTQWSLVSYGNESAETPVIPGSTITLDIQADGQATGSGGCNSYGSQVEVQNSSISFSPVTSTKMACDGEGIMPQEQAYFQALESAAEFELTGDQLKIRYNDGQGVLIFDRRAAEEPGKPSGDEGVLAGTQWQLDSFGTTGGEEPVVEGSKLTLEFGNTGQVGGSGGCNEWGGTWGVEGNSIFFGQIIQTERACVDERLMVQEQRYLQALMSAESFELDGDRLTITYGGGQGVLNFLLWSSVGVTP